MGAKGDLGIALDLDKVPTREPGMTAYEMMLSESQERMLMVLRPEKHGEAEAIFKKWGLDFADVGRTTDDLRFRVRRHGDEVADLPIKELGDEAPEYDRPWADAEGPRPARPDKPADGRCRRGAADADRLARPFLAPLGLRAVRPPRAGQHRAAAGRRRGGGQARRQRPRARALARRDAALRRGRSLRGRASRRSPSAGATSPPSARRRSPSPTI